jgi:hypothetical protein
MEPQGTVFDIDLIVTDREQSQVTPNSFEALERTAQVIMSNYCISVPFPCAYLSLKVQLRRILCESNLSDSIQSTLFFGVLVL